MDVVLTQETFAVEPVDRETLQSCRVFIVVHKNKQL